MGLFIETLESLTLLKKEMNHSSIPLTFTKMLRTAILLN